MQQHAQPYKTQHLHISRGLAQLGIQAIQKPHGSYRAGSCGSYGMSQSRADASNLNQHLRQLILEAASKIMLHAQ
jgi:hypothetical protein